ncbi:hypothetical protein EJ06DRAFT_558979 [Trichodelitschia bisporula]|uniref:Uncharacterized protein n=1 Tax=Trichodelitschia bisporula TaxID=703511 RepID=A0A6G1HNE1_9PEZI|nr:hypothetical protein EJ06DRAFT_558979 [Trichodelitschia bisporula]
MYVASKTEPVADRVPFAAYRAIRTSKESARFGYKGTVDKVDTGNKAVTLKSGSVVKYNKLVSIMAVDASAEKIGRW